MTMLVVALLGGKTKEEWRNWITDRVKNHFGHATPDALPQLYSQSRLMAFKAKRAAEEAREKERMNRLGDPNATPGFGFARILGSTGGMSYRPGDTGVGSGLMFDNDDTESEDSDDMDSPESRSFFSHTFGFRKNEPPPTNSANKSLREQLEGLERHTDGKNGSTSTETRPNGKAGSNDDIKVDTDNATASKPPAAPPRKSETPPPPKQLPNGVTMEQKPRQFESKPGSDKPAPVVKAEGLMDTSESPLKG